MPPLWVLEFKTKIKTINLFKDVDATNEEDIKNQKISTIIFLIVFTLSVIALFLYSSLTPITKTLVIKQPSLSDYKQLEKEYSNALVCTCTSVSNEYNKFISSFTPTFNQICSSDFVSDSWLNYVNYRPFLETQYHYVWDFRHSAYAFFNTVRTLCILASQTINDRLSAFYSTILLTENVISEDIFLTEINAAHDHFVSASANSFVITLNSVLLIGQFSDMMINRLQTNWQLYLISIRNMNITTYAWNVRLYESDESCSTATDLYWCTPTGIYFRKLPNQTTSNIAWGNYRAELQFKVPGIRVGNFLLYAVLQSNLSCLYNRSCLSELNKYLNDSLYPFNATPLAVPSSSSSYLPTVNHITQQLMVDFWQLNSSYQDYFNVCNPLACTYTSVHQFDVIFIITTVISFIGGIVTVLMITILPIVKFLRKLIKSFSLLLPSSQAVSCETRTEQQDVNVTTTEQHISLFAKMKNFLLNLNFFSDPDKQSERYLRDQRLSTRFFIISMVISLCILILYTSISFVTKTITIKQPSIDVYFTLQDKYPQTLTCPCSSITNEHYQFISFQSTFHPVCHSDFITDNWAKYLIVNDSSNVKWNDFRYTNSKFFPSIASFCKISLETVNNQLLVFNSTKYVTKYVQQVDLFHSQTQQLVSNMKQTTVNSYQLLISMLRQTIWGNALFSVSAYGYTFDRSVDNWRNITIYGNDLALVFYPLYYNIYDSMTFCSCKIQPTTCKELSSISAVINGTLNQDAYTVPGYYTGCYAGEALFQSNFECFFNETCLQTIYDLIHLNSKYPFNATVMHLNNSHYNITTNLQYMIDNLMVEDWNDQISFESYFKECNPYLCTYSYDLRGDSNYVLAITIGLIGGLTTILKLIIPFIVTIIRRWQQKRRININESMVDTDIQTTTTIQKLKIEILILNLFKNRNKRSEEQLQHQRILTRFFLIITLITLIILLLYISFDNITNTIMKKNPTIDDFNKLNQEYPNIVQCPCKTYSIPYQQLITFKPRLHSICSSKFIDQTSQWITIDYPSSMEDIYGVPIYSTRKDDFRHVAGPFFQLLNSFCTISSQTINAELIAFYSDRFITLNLITFEQFQTQINHLINQFISNTARSFINSLYVAENMTSTNMLFSAFSTDSMFSDIYPDPVYSSEFYEQYDNFVDIYDRRDQTYNSSKTGIDCDCQQTSWCVQHAIIYDLDTITPVFSPPGIFLGCYLVEAVLQSDLRCFFDVDCLQKLVDSLSLININVSDIVLNLTTSHYQANSSLLEIFSNIMVEEWNNQTFYDDYFNICQPSVCTATYISRGNIIYIVTTTIGLIGGLTKIYRFSLPLLMKIILRFIIPCIRKRFGTRNNVGTVRNA